MIKMEARIRGVPHIDMVVNEEEIAAIIDAGARHYDSTCRAAVNVGGFVYGWSNMVSDGPCTVTATFRQLDTVAKILESAHSVNAGQLSQIGVRARIQNILHTYGKLNHVFDTWKVDV